MSFNCSSSGSNNYEDFSSKRKWEEPKAVFFSSKKSRVYEEVEESAELEGNVDSNQGCSDEETTPSTKVKSLAKFKVFIASMNGFTHRQRIESLRSYMSAQKHEHDLYIPLKSLDELSGSSTEGDEIWIRIALRERSFQSSAFTEANIKEEKNAEPEKYHMLKVYENVPVESDPTKTIDKTIMKLYCSQNGLKGELSWVNKVGKIQGANLIRIYELLDSILPIKKTYLYDDATHSYPLEGRAKPVKLHLRKLMVLTNTNNSFESWYQSKWGFQPRTLRAYRAAMNTFTQNVAVYEKAITTIRNTKLATLQTIYPSHAAKIKELQARYLEDAANAQQKHRTITSKTPLTLRRKANRLPAIPQPRPTATVHDLVKEINQATRSGQDTKQANEDLVFVFENLIDEYSPILRTHSAPKKKYKNALRQLDMMRMYKKTNPLHIAS